MDSKDSRTSSASVSNNSRPDVSPTSPIDMLPSYILWLIFEMNSTSTGSDLDSPLTTCISSSQICCTWRRIMLNSPSIWGRLIDFEHPFLLSRSWRTELLRRSENAPLWIQGRVDNRQGNDYLFFILKNHWERIQVLDIQPWSGLHANSLKDDELWAAFLRPAPILQTFKFSNLSYESEPDLFPNSPIPLFADQAPQLKVFRSTRVALNLRAPWISHVQDIYIPHPSTLADALGALKNMRALRSISFDSLVSSEADVVQHISPTTLPYLREIWVRYCPIEVWLPMLERIISPPDSSLLLISMKSYQHAEPMETTLKSACDQIMKFAQLPIPRSPPARILLRVNNEPSQPFQFELSLYDGQGDLYILVHLVDYPVLSHLLMLRFASSSLLNDVQKMSLHIPSNATDLSPGLAIFIASLASTTSLETSDYALCFLLEFVPPGSLPKLHTLTFYRLLQRRRWPGSWKLKYPSGVIMAFLQRRKSIGRPVSVLDLTDQPFSMLYDMDFLERLSGLMVRYQNPVDKTVVNYRCGSGQPENLRFQSNSYQQ